jgi:hypothetical protein
MELSTSWSEFYDISYLVIFQKSVDKKQGLFKADKNNWYFT